MNRPILLPAQLADEVIMHARLRVWASDVRKQRPPYQFGCREAATWAAILCRVLDTIDALQHSGKGNLLDFDRTKEMILERLKELGFEPPVP